MSCSNPVLAVDLGYLNENGKRSIKFLPRRLDFNYQDYLNRYGDSLLALPCGKCDGCILARRKMWALRCYCESLYYSENSFVTLTYDDDNLPNKLDKKHFQSFIKSLRNHGIKVRYYGCGEYGGETGRPHYHIILFGYWPADSKYFCKSKSGFYQYESKFLNSLWNKGFVTVSEFTAETAAYTAGYVDKKYKIRDCFSLMSKKPGIGEQYFLDHYEQIYNDDSIVVNFGSHVSHVPAYFDKLAEKIGFDISSVKDKRLVQMNYLMYKSMRDLNTIHHEDFFVFRREQFKDKLDKKKRCL